MCSFLSVCLFNARSLCNKLSLFQSFVYSSNHNVFCITETWLSGLIHDGEILPSKFVLYRKDRPSRGGGVLIAVNDSLPSLCIPSPPNLELLCVKIVDFVVCCVYVAPNSNLEYTSCLIDFLIYIVSSYCKQCLN